MQTGGDLNLELSGATGQEFKPIEGVRGYFQWFEDGGYVSPVYTAVSDANGRLNIGAKPYIAADGKLIQFDADPTVSAGHEKYRFWVDQKTIPEGYQLQYITGEQVVFPQGAATITQGGSGSNTAKNTHENWKILLMQKPKAEMHREDAKETQVQSSTGGYMTGKVSWDYTSGVGGVQWKFVANHTTPAPDVIVRASYLSDYAMKQIYSAETARLMGVSDASKIRGRGWTSAQEADLQKWVKEQIAKDPTKWIAETVTAKTNAEGEYILQFNGTWGTTRNAEVATDEREVGGKYDGSLHKWTEKEVNRLGTVANNPNEGTFNRGLVNYWNRKHINYDWMFVSTDETDDLRVMTPYNNNYYTAMNSDWGIHSGWSGVGFGVGVTNAVTSTMKSDFVFGINNVNFEIANYDTGANTALPGDVAETKTTGLPYSKTSERFRIVWYDQEGNVVKEGKAVTPDGTGQIPSEPFDTKGITKTTEFTAKLYRVDKNGKDQELIAVDSFVVQISNFVLTRYEDFSLANPKPMDNAKYEAEGLPDGLTINAENGTVSGRPSRAGFYNVKISTTIQDEGADIKGSRDYRALVTDSPLEHGEVDKEYKQEVKPQEIEGYVFKNVTSKFMDGKAIEGLTIENNQITGTPTAEVPATQTTEDGAMGPNVEVTYDIYKLNSKGEEVLVKKGHKDFVPLEITKADSQAPKYVPEYADVDGTPGTEVTTEAPKFLDQKSTEATKPEVNPQPTDMKFTIGDGAPQGAKIDEDTGKVTYTPSADDAGKTIEVPVKVTYSDGTIDEAVAKINVGDAQNKAYQPEYTVADGIVGQQTTVSAPNFKDGDGQDTTKPADVKFTLGAGAPENVTIDEATGQIKYTPTADQAGTTVRIPVVATYKDGSTDEVVAPIKVGKADKENYEPNYKSVVAQVGHEVTVDSPDFLDNEGNKVEKKPAVTKYELGEGAKDGVKIDANTGEIKYTAVDADKSSDVDVPVVVTYADGSKDNTIAKIIVPSDGDFYNPEAKPEVIEQGQKPNLTDNITTDNEFPKGTTIVDVTEYKEEGVEDPEKDAIDTNVPGNYVGKVEVRYPDGSKDVVDVPIRITEKTQEPRPVTEVQVDPTEVKPNEEQQKTGLKIINHDETTEVSAKDADGNEVETTYDEKTGEILVTPAKDVKGPITVTVKDDHFVTEDNPTGEKTFDVPVKAAAPKTTVDAGGEKTFTPDGTKQDTGIIITNKDDKTVVEAKDKNDKKVDVEVGDDGKVYITPAEGTEGPIKVTITDDDLTEPVVKTIDKAKTQADETTPVVPAKTEVADKTNLTKDEKDAVKKKIEDANKGKFPQPKEGQQPTKVEVGDDGTATITYPDGSVDTIPGTDLVEEKGKTDAEKNPAVKPDKTEVEDKTTLTKKEKAKVVEEVKKANPEAKDVKVGDDGKATLTYEDGTTNEIPGDDTVYEKGAKDNEKYPAREPEKTEVKDKTKLTPEEKKSVEDKVKEKNPKANKVEVGDDGSVTITYPDDSTNTLTPDQTVKKIVDKAPLQAEVDKNKDDAIKKSDKYKNADQDKKDAYDKALKDANKVLADPNATQDEVNAATKALKAAEDELNGTTPGGTTTPGTTTPTKPSETTEDSPKRTTDRTMGKDRVETAIEISKKYFGQADTVIVVDKKDFPDAMTASVLSKLLKAPILLTDTNKLDSRVAAEIQRLGAKDVIIVGGNKSVSEAVKKELAKFDKDNVERIYGKDRYETSAQVARRVVGITGKLGHAVVASGEVFADALAVAPYASREGYPILLVKANNLPKSISDAITELAINKVTIAGGYTTVSKALEKSLPTVAERLRGDTRYETAIDIANKKFSSSKETFLANGEQWMDALVIGPVGGILDMPILLTPANSAPKSLKDYIDKANIEKITAIGGRSMVSDRVLNELSK